MSWTRAIRANGLKPQLSGKLDRLNSKPRQGSLCKPGGKRLSCRVIHTRITRRQRSAARAAGASSSQSSHQPAAARIVSGDAANNRLIARTSAALQRAIAWVRNRPRTLLATIIGLAIGVVVIWVSHPAAILESCGEVDPLPLLGALLLNVPVVALRAVRAQVVLRFLGHTVSFRSMLPVQLVGQTSSTVTPAASGDYLRAYIWRRQHDIPVRAGAAVVTFERLYSLFLLLALAVLLITLPRHGTIGWVGVAIGLVVAALAPLVLELVTPPSLERFALARITSGRLLGRYASGALEMADNLRRLLRSPQLLTLASGITLTIYVLSGLQVALLITGL